MPSGSGHARPGSTPMTISTILMPYVAARDTRSTVSVSVRCGGEMQNEKT